MRWPSSRARDCLLRSDRLSVPSWQCGGQGSSPLSAYPLGGAIKAGNIQWAVDQQPFLQGYLAIDSMWLYLNNRNIIGGGAPTLTGPAFIDKTNIDAIAQYAKAGTR
jgi:hypothetical protein